MDNELQTLFENYSLKIQKDEWYFASYRDKLSSLSKDYAFLKINDIISFIILQTDTYIIAECIEIILSLIKISDTTEIPKELISNKDILDRIIKSSDSQYISSKYKEILSWYHFK